MTDWLDMEAAAFPDEWHGGRERFAFHYAEHGRLRCGGCDRWSTGRAERWRAYLGREDDDSIVTVVALPGVRSARARLGARGEGGLAAPRETR